MVMATGLRQGLVCRTAFAGLQLQAQRSSPPALQWSSAASQRVSRLANLLVSGMGPGSWLVRWTLGVGIASWSPALGEHLGGLQLHLLAHAS